MKADPGAQGTRPVRSQSQCAPRCMSPTWTWLLHYLHAWHAGVSETVKFSVCRLRHRCMYMIFSGPLAIASKRPTSTHACAWSWQLRHLLLQLRRHGNCMESSANQSRVVPTCLLARSCATPRWSSGLAWFAKGECICFVATAWRAARHMREGNS